MPFTEAAQYGTEIFYPHDNDPAVTKKNGEFVFDGDFGPAPEPQAGRVCYAAALGRADTASCQRRR
jgi:hypothetical protein